MKLKLEVDKPEVKKTIVVYSGRFQPFHKGHFISYQKLVSKFGRENVYIGTSNVTDSGKSPFTFEEKKKIATKIFGVPSDKFVQIKNPYAPKEILDKYDGKTTQYVAAVGEKDASRLTGKYFKPYKGKAGYGYDEIGYVYAVPAEPNPISGTDVRTNFKGADEKGAKDFFKKIYPKFDDEIYQMIKNKLNEAGTGFPTGMAGSFDKINVIDDEDLNTEGFPGGIGTGLVLPGGYINGAPTGSANESVNTNPSSKLRPEPHPTRHQIEHPAEEEDAFDGNVAPYDPIAEIIANAITENDFNQFIANYLNEQPQNEPQNPIYDKELTYTAKDGQKKKITVKGALRLPSDHEAHIQAKKLTQNVAQPIKPAPEKKPTPPQKGQPVQKGQTQQGKVDKKTEPNKGEQTSKVEKLKGKTSGKEIQTISLEGGGKVYGTIHRNTKMVDDIIDDVKNTIPKEKWKDIVFVGEGGATNDKGELEFHDEMKYAAPKFKELGASIDTFDGDELDVHNADSKLYKKQMEKTGLNHSQVKAGNWASMIGQGEGTDTMSPNEFLDDEGKNFLQKSAKEAGFPEIENWDNPTEQDKDTLYRLSFPEDNGDKETKVNDIQVAFNNIRDENIIEKNKELTAQGKIPITIAGESHVDLVDKMMKQSNEPQKSKDGGSDKGGKEQPQPKTLKGAELKSSAEHAKEKEKAKKGLMNVVKTLDKEDREFISNGEHKAGSSSRNGMMSNIKSGLQKFGNGIKQWAENKKEMVKGSGEAVWALANGQKIGSTKNKETGKWEYSEEKRKEQIHHLKHFAVDTALIMGSMALGGAGAAAIKAVNAGASLGGTFAAAGSGAVGVFTHGVGGFSAHLAKDIAKHATLETLGLGAKQAAIGGAGLATASMGLLEIAGGTDFVNNVLKKVAEKMETYELSDEQLKKAVVDYKKEKDKGELSSLFGSLNENISPSKAQNIQHFIEYATKRLKLNEKPKVVLLKDNELDREQPSLGGYSPLTKEIFVVTSGRLTADILRTIAHEMVHRKQDEMKLIRNEEEAGKTGSPVENQANALAGILLRDYGKLNKQIYTETIKKVGDDYVVYPKKGGKRLGTHSSLASAKKQLAAIEINKEDITLDIDKGDEILMGKFKNKKTTVKDIGKDQHGMPTINGKQATTFRKIEEINKGFFKGKMKIGGNEVEVEVELIGADNKNRNYVTKVVGIDKKYQHKLPIGSTLPIPSRIFRWGGWAKIKVPSAFNEAEVKSNSADKGGLIICDNCGHDWYKSEGGNAMYICHVCGYDNQPANKKKLNEALAPKNVKAYYEAIAKAEGLNPLPVKFGSVGKGGAALTFNSKTMKPLYITFDVNRMSDPEYAVIHELTHQIKLETEKDAYQGKKDQSASFKKVESKLVNKYFYSNYSKLLYSKQLNEGGAYGHMAHPFDDMDLTFGDLKNIITGALNGELELTREKTDGQALAISWKNGRLIAARNKGHLANAGANAMGIEGIASKFGGRGGLTDAYNFAMKDLSAAIQSLSEKQRQKIFNEGQCFMNLEVIWPTSVNVIPYGQALLVFHNTTCYDEKGNAVGSDQSAANILAGMIKQVNADVQSKYTIQGPPVTELPKNEELGSKQSKYLSKLSKLQNEFRLSDGDTVALYHQKWWEDFVNKKAPKTVDKLTKEALVRRWAFGEKSFRLASISDEDIKKWATETDKIDVMKQQKTNIKPFEEIFLGVGADVLSFMGSVLTANPNAAIRSMKDRLKSTAERVRQSGDKSLILKLKQELERLNSLGGKDRIVPNEGIVFVYKGNTYKLTGTFAPLNQILGLFY